jgi:tRNA 5-methylaminomethyl-2-thiouridine biosynthesis bifunctional protein
MNQIKNSAISWQDDTPFSQQFTDYYFNSDGGIAETLHVFVNPSNIAQRYQQCERSFFSIYETGFGTGLNFYCTLMAIQSLVSIKPSKPIYFHSSELFPLSIDDFKKSATRFNQFSDITEQICQQYPPAVKGYHRIILNGGAIYLTLLFDDSLTAFEGCRSKTDAWYLDGFSPAKNADMWKSELFGQIAHLSYLNSTTLATFTSAGFVRRSLQEHGFSLQKHNGFGKKREMVTGLLTSNHNNKRALNTTKPWFNIDQSKVTVKHVAIIGAGLAGCTTAEALARRGIQVTLYDESAAICQHASGNRQGALYAKLPSKPTVSGEIHLTGLEYSLRMLEIYQCFDGNTADQCGLLQLATNEKEQKQQQDLLQQDAYSKDIVYWVNAEQASNLIGSNTPFNGLFFPRSGWVAPQLFCEKLIDSPLIQLKLNTTIHKLEQLNDQRWSIQLTNETVDSTANYDALIVANANSAKQFEQLQQINIKAIRGQVTHVQQNASTLLNTVVCGAGYISPALNKQFCFGASFDLHTQDSQLKAIDQQVNIQNLSKVLPQLSKDLTMPEQLTGKVAYRCSTPDYLPTVGPAPIRNSYIDKYQKLEKDKNWHFPNDPAPNYPGLFINTGHGSKGLITCPLSAEYLACLITNQPSPLPINLSNALHPARFIIKQLIRRTI